MQHAVKNVVIAIALLSAGFLVAWLRFRPQLGSEGTFTDGVRDYSGWTSEPLRYALWDVAEPIAELAEGSSRQMDPCLSPDGGWLVFAVGERGLGTDLWIAPMQGERPGLARALFEVNGPDDELAPAFVGEYLYFASNRAGGVGGLDLYRVRFENGPVGSPEALPATLNTPADETDPAAMGQTLVFASNQRGEGRGDYDLYLATTLGPEAFRPSPLAKVNEASQERDPALTADGRTLFFASDRLGPRGHYQLFRTLHDHGQWLTPEPVGGLGVQGSLRGPEPSPDGFRLWFSVEPTSDVPGVALPSQLYAAFTRELFVRPGRPIGLTDVLLLLALLVLALLAWLAKRWTTVEVIYRCFLVSLVAHALLLWWFREVHPTNDPIELAQRAGTYEVQLAPSASETKGANQERGGQLASEPTNATAAAPAPLRSATEASTAASEPSPSSASTELAAAPAVAPRALAELERALPSPQRSPEPSLLVTDQETLEPLFGEAAPSLEIGAPREAQPTNGAGAGSATAQRANPTDSSPAQQQTPSHATLGRVQRESEPLPQQGSSSEASPTIPMPTRALAGTPLRGPEETFEPSAQSSAKLGMPEARTFQGRSEQAPVPFERPGLAAAEPGAKGAAPVPDSLGTMAPPVPQQSELPSMSAGVPSMPPAINVPAQLQLADSVEAAPLETGEAAAPETSNAGVAMRVAPSRTFERGEPSSGPGPARLEPGARLERAQPLRTGSIELGPRRDLDLPVAQVTAPLPFDHTPYQNRFGLAKEHALAELGGSAETEAAVASGLAYLAGVQNALGYWGLKTEVYEKYRQLRIGKTGLCLLAFLGAGHTHQSQTLYSTNVAKAIDYLLVKQDVRSGHFGNCSAYGHGVATYALAECFALTGDERLRVPLVRAVRHILREQNQQSNDPRFFGGWSYYYPDGEVYDSWPRTSVTSWQVMALESARLAGLEVPQEALDHARDFLKNAWDENLGAYRYNHAPSRLQTEYKTLPASTPAAMFALSLLGEDLQQDSYGPARMFLLERMPNGYRFEGERAFVEHATGNLYFWYYSSLALLRVGGKAWASWNEALKTTLLPAQRTDGSWQPISIYAQYAGDSELDQSYTTAMCVLSLEVYYRYFTPLLESSK